MENGTSDRPSATLSQQSQRLPKTRSRITAACFRCQKRKIRCDAALPACSACQKVGAQCTGGGASREIPRGLVCDLEARIEWLESIVRRNIPSIDLNGGPPYPSTGTRACPLKEPGLPPLQQENRMRSDSPQEDESLREITDQVGLVSVSTGADLRYLGPSSGLFFTRFVLTGLGRRIQAEDPSPSDTMSRVTSVPAGLLVVQPSDMPPDQKHARWLSEAYFETVHLQFPFLHEPSHLDTIRRMYDDEEVGPISEFQIFMVLAIGATILSRRAKVQLSAEGYCASAMSRLEHVFQRPSLAGVQCVLLLQMYTIHNSSSGLSLWTLHYHNLASVIELGLQRYVPGNTFSFIEQEMRTRIFWCAYTLDRMLSTLMGRPIGLMDEQCDLRLPLDFDDADLESDQPKSRQAGEPLTKMTSAIHLFKLARFNSEIKCVLYCVDRLYPPYTAPTIIDVGKWKEDMLRRLQQWKNEIPRHTEESQRLCTNLLCEIKYHELVMLVLRPSPLFQHPSKSSLRGCFSSAIECSMLYHKLYTSNALHYSWVSVHSLFLCVITMFYCVWTPDGVADEVNIDALVRALRFTSDVLSATGEYWPEAKRSRDVLDRISTTTMQRFTKKFHAPKESDAATSGPPTMIEIPPDFGSAQSVESFDVDSIPHKLQAPQFENGNTEHGVFPLFYSDPADSFTSTDMLSFFIGSEGNLNMPNSEANGDGYPSMDEVVRTFFDDGLREFDHGL